MDNYKGIELHLHYILRQEGVHQMDAKVHNECEKQFLLAIDVLKAYTGDFHVEVKVPNEGGVVDEFILHLFDPSIADFLKIVLTAFLTYYFTKRSNKREDILKGIEIIEKIKEKKLTQEEALAVVADDKNLRKIVSNYYKAAEKEIQIARIETSSNEEGKKNETEVRGIERKDFQTHICETDTTEDTQTIEGTTIGVFSPILQKGHGKTWNGIYSGKTIQFKVEDKEFLEQVYNNEVKFGAATTIKCTLQIKRKQTRTGDDPTVKEDFEYIVKDVLTWADDAHFQSETKRYKKIKADKRQLELFPDENKGVQKPEE